MHKFLSIAKKLKSRQSVQVVLAIVVCELAFESKIEEEKEEVKEDVKQEDIAGVKFEDFAGEQKCAGCHQAVYETHIQTAHFATAQTAEEKYIHGSYKKGRNEYAYTPDIVLKMEKRDSGLFQVAYFKKEEKKAMRFDMVIGSGVMGQSFLTWRENKLFQLPITYFTAADRWSNSPGFPSGKVMIDRPITSRCLECHASFAEGIAGPAMDRKKMMLGVTCEKCHGPAAKHVSYQTENPKEKKAKFIVNPASLSRQLQLDVCSYCHGGNIE